MPHPFPALISPRKSASRPWNDLFSSLPHGELVVLAAFGLFLVFA